MTQVEISATLTAVVERLVDSVYNTKELIEEAEALAKEDGLSSKQLRELITTVAQKRGLSERQTLRLLPDNVKDKTAQALVSKRNNRRHDGNDSSVSKPLGDTYKGDAGNSPDLIQKYVTTEEEEPSAVAQWAAQKQTFTISRKELNKLNEIARERRAMNQFPLVATEGNRLEMGAI